jgi:hypothetical protein
MLIFLISVSQEVRITSVSHQALPESCNFIAFQGPEALLTVHAVLNIICILVIPTVISLIWALLLNSELTPILGCVDIPCFTCKSYILILSSSTYSFHSFLCHSWWKLHSSYCSGHNFVFILDFVYSLMLHLTSNFVPPSKYTQNVTIPHLLSCYYLGPKLSYQQFQ